jgi:hypothetical protein
MFVANKKPGDKVRSKDCCYQSDQIGETSILVIVTFKLLVRDIWESHCCECWYKCQ